MTSIRILLVDDHPMLRLGVRRSLENEESFAIAEECADLASVRAWLSSGGKADVAILDRGLPDGDGLEVVPPLKAAGMKVIVLTVEDDDEEIRAAVDAGVDGYLLKSSPAYGLRAISSAHLSRHRLCRSHSRARILPDRHRPAPARPPHS